jgi:Family of unknown function (DUF6064)
MQQVPMSSEQFFEIFRAYNQALWPAPILWIALAVAAVVLAIRPFRGSDGVIALVLAALWAWAGIAYQIVYHAPHNPVAYGFGLLFLGQAALFLVVGVISRGLTFRFRADAFGAVGGVLIGYALLLYPLLGLVLGHQYPAAPTFGVPCPSTIFTFGMLLWIRGRVPWYVLVVPAMWAAIAVGAALNWGVFEDIVMPAAAVVTSYMLLKRNRQQARDLHSHVESREFVHTS